VAHEVGYLLHKPRCASLVSDKNTTNTLCIDVRG
jgi:hypothetical protein